MSVFLCRKYLINFVNVQRKIKGSFMTKSDTILKSEKDFTNHLVENIHYISEICGWGTIKRMEREYTLMLKNSRIRIDLMLWHDDGTGTCIEVKTGNNNRNDDLMEISQLMFYGQHIEKQLKNLPRMVLVHPNLKPETYEVLKRFKIPIALLKLTDNECIYLNNGTTGQD